MSWDVVIIKVRGQRPARPEEMAAENVIPLGEAVDVRAAVEASMRGLANVEWGSADRGILNTGELSIEFQLAGAETGGPVDSLHLHVRGRGDPVNAILGLTEANAWSAIDGSTTMFLDAKEPSREGWEGYRGLMDRAVSGWDGRTVEGGEDPGWKF